MMSSDFKILFNQLCNQEYEAHWFTRHTTPPTDCSDRAYLLADYCKQNNIPYHFILTLFLDKGLHLSIVIDGMVYDPIWKLYEIPVQEYKKILNGFISYEFGSWIQKIIP